jgi:hypothetical protein
VPAQETAMRLSRTLIEVQMPLLGTTVSCPPVTRRWRVPTLFVESSHSWFQASPVASSILGLPPCRVAPYVGIGTRARQHPGRWVKRSVAAAAIAAGSVLAAGCSEKSDVHLFFAATYSASSDCLDDVAVVDVLSGSDTGRCPQVLCWLNPYSGKAYISVVMCDGPIDWTRVDNPAPGTACEAALAAYQRAGVGSCSRDAGVVDSGPLDAQSLDGGPQENGQLDGEAPDGAPLDAGDGAPLDAADES